MGAFVGIDLGTTNSLVAVRNAYGRPEAVPNGEGSNLTPSVIYFGVDPPAVGQEAKEWARLGNEEIASFFKPFMGNPQFKLRFRGKDYDATALSTLVLKKLKADAEARLGQEVDRAVITVPAYFADAQRKATIAAGEAAGLRVLRIINEPTAAALAYGLQNADRDEHLLIYDLGGGTFDVTVARIAPGEIQVLATAGDHDLGGKNWDDRIADYLAEKFSRDTGIDPLDDPVNLNEVLVRSEQAKWTLSERNSARISLQIGSQRRAYELSRSEFETMTFPLMERTRRLTEEALSDAKLSWRGLSAVLLVGGSTRMPMVRSYVSQMAGGSPRAGVNVDEAVALGAAIQAAMDCGYSASDAAPQFFLAGARRVQDVMSHSLGAVAVSADESRYVNEIVIGRNLPIPADNIRLFEHATHGGANDKLEVYLTQGESESPRDCQILGKYVFSGIEPTSPQVLIEVGVSYDANGIVQVRASQRDLNKRLPMRVEPVPDDLTWLGEPPRSSSPEAGALDALEEMTIYLLIDVSSSMAGAPLEEAKEAARAFLNQCDLTRMEVGLISFSDQVSLQVEAVSNARKILAGIARLNAEGTTNLAEALELAQSRLTDIPRSRYAVILTDGYPDAPEATVRAADDAKAEGIHIVVIGTGDADEDYLKRLASAKAGSIFARRGELVQTFGHIAKTLAEGGRGLRKL